MLIHPNGKRIVPSDARVEIPQAHMAAFREFAEFAAHYRLGIHCSVCGNDLIGRNADQDSRHSVACTCREFIAVNDRPEYRH